MVLMTGRERPARIGVAIEAYERGRGGLHYNAISGKRIMYAFLKRVLWLVHQFWRQLPPLVCQPLLTSYCPASRQRAVLEQTHRRERRSDPLGRNTPSGTLYGFLQAAQSGNYSTAAQYLQMSPARRLTQGEDIATKLKLVIDRAFTGDLRRISNQPEGTPQEGMPLDKQRVGTLNAGDIEADLVLIRTIRR